VDLHVLVRRADVDPVAVVDVGGERLAAFDERREVAAFDRIRDVRRNAIERARLEDVDARVDRVARDLLRVRLLEKAQDVALRIGFHQAVGAGIVDRRQDDRRRGLALAVHPDDGAQVDFRQHVAVEDDDGIVHVGRRVLDGAGRAERRGLHHVPKGEPGVAAVPEDFLDPSRLVVQAEDDLIDFGDFLYEIQLKL
jgi:hypothetical protein